MSGLVTDIGGTNSRIALADNLALKTVRVYPTKEFKKAPELFKRFRKETGVVLPTRWVVSAAGVTTKEMIRGTNVGWDILRNELVETFGLKSCILLNDFEAAAYGLAAVTKDKLEQLGGGSPKDNGTKVLLGAGTGLGEAICVHCERTGWKVIKSEGGHTSFAPTNDIEEKLLSSLRKKYGHVSFERVLSGAGLLELYGFFLELEGLEGRSSLPLTRPSQVTEGAEKGDKICTRTLDLFCRIYGEEAGNLALKTLPEGGVYISGGIALHIISWLKKGPFRQGFQSKGRMKGVLKGLPVFVVKEPFLGLLGGAYRLLQTSMAKSP